MNAIVLQKRKKRPTFFSLSLALKGARACLMEGPLSCRKVGKRRRGKKQFGRVRTCVIKQGKPIVVIQTKLSTRILPTKQAILYRYLIEILRRHDSRQTNVHVKISQRCEFCPPQKCRSSPNGPSKNKEKKIKEDNREDNVFLYISVRRAYNKINLHTNVTRRRRKGPPTTPQQLNPD